MALDTFDGIAVKVRTGCMVGIVVTFMVVASFVCISVNCFVFSSYFKKFLIRSKKFLIIPCTTLSSQERYAIVIQKVVCIPDLFKICEIRIKIWQIGIGMLSSFVLVII